MVEDRENGYIASHNLFLEIPDRKFKLEWATTQATALTALESNHYDLCLVDHQLVAANGLVLIHQAITEGCKTPFILLIEQRDLDIEVAAMQTGVADSLVKSQLDAVLLDHSVHYAIERTRTLEALQESESRLEGILGSLKDVVVWSTSWEPRRTIYVSRAVEKIYGRSVSEFFQIPDLWLQVIHPEDQAAARQGFQSLPETDAMDLEYRILRFDGEVRWIHNRGKLVRGLNGAAIRIDGIATDITERKQAQEALRESEERYALAVQGANDGLWDWNLRTHQIYFSPRWKSMLGYEESEIGHDPEAWLSRVHPDDRSTLQQRMNSHLAGETCHFESEYRLLHRDGSYRWFLSRGLAVRDAEGNVSRMAGSQTDITERKRVEEQLLHDALHDGLTNLPNRALFMNRLKHAVESAQRRKDYLFAVLFLDLDRFKVINDSLGHIVGDQLLSLIAQRLQTSVRTIDTVARLSGDEFAILLEDVTGVNDVTYVAERIQAALAQPFALEGHEVFATVSIGIALSDVSHHSAEDLLRDADTAMYRAKALGRSRYELFNPGMHTRVVALLHLENDLRRAVERQEFLLHYQPIISLANQRLIGFEALIRWQHPQRGLVPPAEFIPVAEETGLIIPIGQWVLQEACRQTQIWQTQYPRNPLLMISVNLSGRQFSEPNLIGQIEQVLQETHLPAHCLKLEITESVIMENAESARTMLLQLKALGVNLSIDDFGTGYSSLNYLHRFPLDTLKIDRSFISQIDSDGEQLEIVHTIVTLAWNLGMDVIAEGVETAKQLAQLKALKCEYGQGFFFSKPMDTTAATALLAQEMPGGFQRRMSPQASA